MTNNSSNNKMSVIDFFNKFKIKYAYVKIRPFKIVNGVKVKQPINQFSNNFPYNPKFKYSMAEWESPSPALKQIQEYYLEKTKKTKLPKLSTFNFWYSQKLRNTSKHKTEYIAYRTTHDIASIDIDDAELAEKLKNYKNHHPYIPSRNRRLPHYIVKPIEMPENTNYAKHLEKIDLLCGQAGVVRADDEVFLPPDFETIKDCDIKSMVKDAYGDEGINKYYKNIKKNNIEKYEDGSPMPNHDTSEWDRETMMKHLQALPEDVKTQYESWRAVSTYMKKMGRSIADWIMWSCSCSKFRNNPPTVQQWNGFQTGSVGGDYIIKNLLKKHNLEYWEQNFSDYSQFKNYEFYNNDEFNEDGKKRYSNNKPLNIRYIEYLNREISLKSIKRWANDNNYLSEDNDGDECFTKVAPVKKELNKRKQKLIDYMGIYICFIKSQKIYINLDYDERGKLKDKFDNNYNSTPVKAKLSWAWCEADFAVDRLKKKVENCKIGGFNAMDFVIKKQKCRIYEKTEFCPNKNLKYDKYSTDNIFNLWTGWEYIYNNEFKVDMELIKPIIEVFKEVFSDTINRDTEGNRSMYEYQMKKLKMILCGKKTKVATSVWSKFHGSGKNSIFEYFGLKLLGFRYTAVVSSIDDILARFNGLLCGKMLVIVEELDRWGKGKEAMNKIKTLTTSTFTKKELKGIDSALIRDYSNNIYLSNFKNCLPAESKHCRRMDNLQSGCKFTKAMMNPEEHTKFWRNFHNKIGSQQDIGTREYTDEEKENQYDLSEHFFHYIMSFDIEDFAPQQMIKTEDRVSGEQMSVHNLIKFVRCLFFENKEGEQQYRNYPEEGEDGFIKLSYNLIFKKYKTWFKITGEKDTKEFLAKNASQLSKLLGEHIPEIKTTGGNISKKKYSGFVKHTRNGNIWCVKQSVIDNLVKNLEHQYSFNHNCYIEINDDILNKYVYEDDEQSCNSYKFIDELGE
jgi:hypothetical protein